MTILGRVLRFSLRDTQNQGISLSGTYAGVVELADTPDLGSGAARFGGSSPPSRISSLRAVAQFITLLCLVAPLGCVKPSPYKNVCFTSPLTDENAQLFLTELVTETAAIKRSERLILSRLTTQLRENSLRAKNLDQENDGGRYRNQIFFAEGDTFPSLRVGKGNQEIELRLDPHLRSFSISRLSKIAISPDGKNVGLVGYAPAIQTNLLILLNTETLKSEVLSLDVYDAMWGDSARLFFSTEENLRPSKVYRYEKGGTSTLVKASSSSSEALLISKSRDGSHVFIEASAPSHSDLYALSANSGFSESFSRLKEPPGGRVTAIGNAIFLLTFKLNPYGTVAKFDNSHDKEPIATLRGTPSAPFTNLDSHDTEILVFKSLGTQTSVTLVDENLKEIRNIKPLGPTTTLTPLPQSPLGRGGGVLASSFLHPTRALSVAQLQHPEALPESPLGAESALEVPSDDGVLVPVSLVSPVHPRGLVVFAYGSYGRSLPATNSPYITTLLENNLAVAIAHVRGGGDKGPMWHRGGVGGNRRKSIEDLVAVIRALHAHGIGAPESTVVEGRSAGAWLAAMTASLVPNIFASMILEAPFLDATATTQANPLPLSKWDESEWSTKDPDLSPLHVMTEKFQAKTLTLIPSKDQLVPMRGTLEWVRRGRCATNSPDHFAIDLLKGETHEGPLTSSDEVETFALKVAFILRSIDEDSRTSQDRRK